MPDVEFAYLLPLTYLRITGTQTRIDDELDGSATVEYHSVVTTEVGADPLTDCQVRMSAEALTTQKSTWNLLADGRLTGADMSTTAEPLAIWKTSLEAGAAVLGAVGAPLLAAGPPGWIALGGAAGAATIGAGLAARGRRLLTGSVEVVVPATGDAPQSTDASMDTWKVHKDYQEEHRQAAQALANYRDALATGAAAHAKAARAWAMAADDQTYWEYQVRSLQRMLAWASAGAEHAEAAYAKWMADKRQTVVTAFDERIRIDDLPDLQRLTNWAADPGSEAEQHWIRLAKEQCVAVTVDLEELAGDERTHPLQTYQPKVSDGGIIHRRQPRPAVLTTWKLKRKADGTYQPEQVDIRRELVAYPGNEQAMSIEGEDRTSGAVAVVFDASGALTSVAATLTDPALQRAKDISALIPAVTAAAESGRNLVKAISPPSLVERAAEAKAAKELEQLGKAPEPPDPRQKDLAEQQLLAQLKIAQQINSSTSVPVVVSITQPAG